MWTLTFNPLPSGEGKRREIELCKGLLSGRGYLERRVGGGYAKVSFGHAQCARGGVTDQITPEASQTQTYMMQNDRPSARLCAMIGAATLADFSSQ